MIVAASLPVIERRVSTLPSLRREKFVRRKSCASKHFERTAAFRQVCVGQSDQGGAGRLNLDASISTCRVSSIEAVWTRRSGEETDDLSARKEREKKWTMARCNDRMTHRPGRELRI